MALEQRNYQSTYVRELEIPEVPQKQIQNRPSRKIFSVGEKFLFVLFTSIVVLFSIVILHTQATINDTSREVDVMNAKIAETSKQNNDLANQISQEITYENIWKKAKERGLSLNTDNVKPVTGR